MVSNIIFLKSYNKKFNLKYETLLFIVPGTPSNVSFPDVTSTTARIIWDVPVNPNGEILAYRINYQLHSSDGYNFSKEFRASDRTFRYCYC